jgi:hypothetical protein
MKTNPISASWILPLTLLLLAGCSTTSLTDSWQSPELHKNDMSNVLVVAMTPSITNRILFERGFVKALQDKGIQATASYEALGDELPTRESVTPYLQSNGKTHVIVAQYGGSTVTKEVVPESVRTYYTGPYYPTYRGYWDQNTVTMVRDSYVEQTTTVMLTTSIYEVQSEQLVWVGRSKSFEVESIAYGANELARQVIGNLRK